MNKKLLKELDDLKEYMIANQIDDADSLDTDILEAYTARSIEVLVLDLDEAFAWEFITEPQSNNLLSLLIDCLYGSDPKSTGIALKNNAINYFKLLLNNHIENSRGAIIVSDN